MNNRHPWQLKKIEILGAVLELPAKQHCQFGIVLGAEYSYYVKSIATYAPTFFGCNNSVLAPFFNADFSPSLKVFETKPPLKISYHVCWLLTVIVECQLQRLYFTHGYKFQKISQIPEEFL